MIAELFYPYEVKEAILNLEKNSNLRDGFKKRFFTHSLICLLRYLIIFIGLYFFLVKFFNINLYFAIAIEVFAISLVWNLVIHRLWKVFYEPYITGKLQTGCLVKVRYLFPHFFFYIENEVTGNLDMTNMARHFDKKYNNFYVKGERITYLRSADGFCVMLSPVCIENYCPLKLLEMKE